MQTTDSKQRFAIQNKILQFLYEKPHQQQRTEMLKILERQEQLSGATAFLYKGKFYGKRGRKPAAPLQNPELKERMDELLKQDAALNSEKAYVVSYISAVLNLNAYAGTYVSVFPSVLHGLIRECVPNFDGEAREVMADALEKVRKFNARGESLLKQRILKNAVLG